MKSDPLGKNKMVNSKKLMKILKKSRNMEYKFFTKLYSLI